MGLSNCSRCGKVFNSEKASTICPDCSMEEAKDQRKVNEYLRRNPLAGIMDVARGTGVNQGVIFRLVKQGSLKITKAPSCRLCGKEIKSGTTCPECSAKIENMKKKKHPWKNP